MGIIKSAGHPACRYVLIKSGSWKEGARHVWRKVCLKKLRCLFRGVVNCCKTGVGRGVVPNTGVEFPTRECLPHVAIYSSPNSVYVCFRRGTRLAEAEEAMALVGLMGCFGWVVDIRY